MPTPVRLSPTVLLGSPPESSAARRLSASSTVSLLSANMSRMWRLLSLSVLMYQLPSGDFYTTVIEPLEVRTDSVASPSPMTPSRLRLVGAPRVMIS